MKAKKVLENLTQPGWHSYPVNWQTCPLCNGTGIKSTPGMSTGCPPCEVCEGKRIINLITGKPPKN